MMALAARQLVSPIKLLAVLVFWIEFTIKKVKYNKLNSQIYKLVVQLPLIIEQKPGSRQVKPGKRPPIITLLLSFPRK